MAPIRTSVFIPPVDYQAVTGKSWSITGMKIGGAHQDAALTSNTTGLAFKWHAASLVTDDDPIGIAATGIYSASGQYHSRDLNIDWKLLHPRQIGVGTAEQFPVSSSARNDTYLDGFEINILTWMAPSRRE